MPVGIGDPCARLYGYQCDRRCQSLRSRGDLGRPWGLVPPLVTMRNGRNARGIEYWFSKLASVDVGFPLSFVWRPQGYDKRNPRAADVHHDRRGSLERIGEVFIHDAADYDEVTANGVKKGEGCVRGH